VEALQEYQREYTRPNSPVTRKRDLYDESEKSQVVIHGKARYSIREVSAGQKKTFERSNLQTQFGVVPRRNSFVPDVDEGILF